MTNRVGTWLAVLGCLLAAASSVRASTSFTCDRIIVQGDAAPGTEPGTVFSPLVDGYFPNVPTLDGAGHVSLVARLEGPAVTTTNDLGIWSMIPGSLSLIARTGETAPGSAPGAVFAGFPTDIALTPPTAGSGRIGFAATVSGPGIDIGNDEGVWMHDADGTYALALEAAQVPGFLAGVVFTAPFGIQVNHAGDAFVGCLVTGPGIGSTNDEIFLSNRGGTLAKILQEGDQVPGMAPGVQFGGAGMFIGTGYSFVSLAWNNASRMAVSCSIMGTGVNTYNNEAVFAEKTGGLTLVAREGDQVPGMSSGTTFGGNGVTADFGPLAFDRLGDVAFTARIGGASPSAYAIVSDASGSLAGIATEGEPAPGTDQDFRNLYEPVLSDGGRIAFRGAVSDSGYYPPLGIWWDQAGSPGEVAPLVLPGDPVPDRPGATLSTASHLQGFTSNGALAFSGFLDDPARGSEAAIFLADPSGEIATIAAAGDLFDVDGSAGDGTDRREIETVRFGDIGESGEFAIRVEFTDGTFGFYLVHPLASSVGTSIAAVPFGAIEAAPSPFAQSTSIRFELARAGRAAVSVYDARGRRVRRLWNGERPAGSQSVSWDGRDDAGRAVASGLYWARLETAEGTRSAKMALFRN
jgi:hypothetical protein